MKIYVAMVLLAVLAIVVCSPSLAHDRPGAPDTGTAPQGDTYKCIA
jgi:hypothetical protein